MSIVKQAVKEFSIAFLVASGWALYNYFSASKSITDTITAFASSFFLVAWATGQFFRIRKQEKVENSFTFLEKKLSTFISVLEERTAEITNQISGGDSYPVFNIASIDNASDRGILVCAHHGRHPLYDVSARICDINKFNTIIGSININNFTNADTNVTLGTMTPNHCIMIGEWNVGAPTNQKYNIFTTARNGSFTQVLRFVKLAGIWSVATKVVRSASPAAEEGLPIQLFEQIDPNFPRNPDGSVAWD